MCQIQNIPFAKVSILEWIGYTTSRIDTVDGGDKRYECHCYYAASNAHSSSNGPRYLEPPIPVKQFLISPPSSPPPGWEQQIEPIPYQSKSEETHSSKSIVNHNELFDALLKVQQERDRPSQEQVFVSCSDEMPSIVLHRCKDST
ncbi:hypothetical protein ACOME3_008939 [Neoechinorhynchus agilis]